MNSETICAIATGMTKSGISIIRVSGPEAVSICTRIYCNKSMKKCLFSYKSHTIHYGFIVRNMDINPSDKDIVDEVMISIMKAPNSYTTEDTVEINCHGGISSTREVLQTVINAGARLAQPGEFTKRAFLNGRIDLTKAEAVMDFIDSESRLSYQISLSQVKGSVYSTVKALREKIIYEIAFIESALDDPEHISLDGYSNKLKNTVDTLLSECDEILHNSENGLMIKNGIKTVIVGKPNAGKSSLLNRLLRKERSIVTPIAGTTRDSISEKLVINDVVLNIVDTAGIRNSDDVVEKIGVEKSKEEAEDADLVIFVCDLSVPFDSNDYEIASMLKEKRCIVLFNKCDLDAKVSKEDIEKLLPGSSSLEISAASGDGLHQLEEKICSLFLKGDIDNNTKYITNMRQLDEIKNVRESLLNVLHSIELGMPEDFFSIDLMNAYSALGRIIGEEISDDLVNEIFSKFCMGK